VHHRELQRKKAEDVSVKAMAKGLAKQQKKQHVCVSGGNVREGPASSGHCAITCLASHMPKPNSKQLR